MSREQTKSDLLHYLTEEKVVIALKGKWGTGKTYLWENELANQIPRCERPPLYASAFGLTDVDALRLALYQSALGELNSIVSNTETIVKKTGVEVAKLVSKYIPGAEALAKGAGGVASIIQSTLIQKMLSDRILVIDDIERRDAKFSISSMLGFISSMKRANCKIIIILNEEQLEAGDGAKDWKNLKEKAIDIEISLATSPADACKIGLSRRPPFADVAEAKLVQLGVSNIRVIERVSKTLVDIFGEERLPEVLSKELVHTVVALTCASYGALRLPISVSTIKSDWPKMVMKGQEQAAEEMNSIENQILIAEMGLSSDLVFFNLFIEHLETGSLLRGRFAEHFERRRLEASQDSFLNSARAFITSCMWDPSISSEQLLHEAESQKMSWSSLPPVLISQVLAHLNNLDPNMAKDVLEVWKSAWRQQNTFYSIYTDPNFEDLLGDVRDVIEEVNIRLSNQSLRDSVVRLVGTEWTSQDVDLANSVSVDRMLEELTRLDKMTFQSFVNFYKQELNHPTTTGDGARVFKRGTETFLRAISSMPSSIPDRTRQLLKFHFRSELSTETPSNDQSKTPLSPTGKA